MKKIYYLEKHLVKIGDVIECNGIKAIVTEELIELNPELFRVEKNIQPMYFKCTLNSLGFTLGRVYEQICHDCYPNLIFIQDDDSNKRRIYNWQEVRKGANNYGFELTTKTEWDKQELLDKAKKDYPAGTVLKDVFGNIYTVSKNSSYTIGEHGSILIDGIYVHRDGRWAKVLPLKFITEDGVSIYGDMKTYAICRDALILELPNVYGGNSPSLIYFYYKENALAYIEKYKRKSLEDYENLLVNYGGVIVYRNGATHDSVWDWFKTYEPKLYYTKILQLIADDLNDGWVADFTNNDDKWSIVVTDIIINYKKLQIQGLVYFKLEELANKARDILGDKVKYIFN